VEIFKLVDGDKEDTAFYHDPSRYEVEAGRVDWQEKTKGVLSTEVEYEYSIRPTFSGTGYTTIDFTHPFNSSGRVRKIFVMCNVDPTTGGKIKLFRPKADGTLTVVEDITFGVDNGSYVYSQVRDTYVIDVDFRARRGDLLGFYNVDLYLGDVITTQPDAMFYYFPGEAAGSFDPGEVIAYGNLGLNYYARGDNLQDLVLLEIDMGDRVNISSLSFYGEELTEDFEFNVAICDDINWSISLFGGTHSHFVDDAITPENSYTATHNNIAYGRFLLGDGITHTEDALGGTSYGMAGDGFYTSGETYCYINGDAEWLNLTPGENFGTPRYTASPPTDFETDPIAYTLTFQDNKDIYKTRVYFKDRENFIKFHWAYFLGEYEPIGNTYDNRYSYIPEYTAVVIDETRFDADTVDSNVKAYLFTNPTIGTWTRGAYDPGSDTYALGGDQQAALTSAVVRWNVLSHEFETINTKSIQFYTNNHVSTKIMEMEVFSTVPNDPSLLDDVLVSYSREGDYWVDTAFEDALIDGVEVSSALINDNPQFINLEIRSSSTIKYHEFELRLNDDAVRSGDDKCLDAIHPSTTRRGEVNPAYSFPIWNTYEESLNMQVDIPRDEGDDHLILWSKMGSADELATPEVGPAGQYYKNPDYLLQNNDYNVAINCPCWGLQNLANGKEVYYNNNDTKWIYWGTYASGTSLDISHPDKRITEFEINPVSATYFKIVPTDNAIFAGVSEMYFYFDDTELDYTAWSSSDLNPATPFTTLAPELTDDDFTTGNYNLTVKPYVVDDFEGTVVDSTKWTVENPAYLTVSGSELIGNVPSASDAFLRSSTKWYLPQGVNWTIIVEFELDNWTIPSSGLHQFDFGVIAKNTTEFFSGRRELSSSNVDEIWGVYGTGSWPDGSAGGVNTPYPGDLTDLYFKMWRPFNNRISMEYGSAANPAQRTQNRDGFSDETEGFWIGMHMQCGTTGSPPTYRVKRVYIDYGTEGLIGGSFGVHTAVNNIRIAHGIDLPILDWSGEPIESDPRFDIYISYDNITYSYWQTIASFTEYYMEFDTYAAIDLEKRYDLDMIRHYGTGASSFDITDYKLYFNNDTSDPNNLEPSGELEEWIYQTGYIGAAYAEGGDGHYPAGSTRDSAGLQFGGSNRYRSVAKFDPLPTLPTDIGHIVDFNLELYINDRYGDPTNTEVWLQLYECLFNWNPDESDDKWDPTPGVHIGTTVVGEVVYPDVFTNWPIGWAEIALNSDGIELLQDWIDGVRPNYGWYIVEKNDYVDEDVYPIESRVGWFNETYGTSSLHPRIRILYRNSNIDTGSINDCRWPIIVIPEGETLRKIGVYPDIGTLDAPGGGYNHSWDDLGNILTDYDAKTNVAFDATVSGSSYFAGLILDFITDGVIPDGEIEKVWGSDDSSTQWLKIYLDDEYSIDEFRCYWGYFSADDEWMIDDYKIYTSTDDITYYERVSETGNTDHFRTHILTSPVQARYVRIDISSYTAGTMPVQTESGVVDFEGATVREIEVLQAQDTTSISSENYPIVAVNLQTHFQVSDYNLVQFYPDDPTTYWEDDVVRYSSNTFDDPYKIEYSSYGVDLTQAQWISIKNNTATELNDGPDYLDNIRVLSVNKHFIHKFPWWWDSRYSTLSSDYSIENTGSSLKIEYTGGITTSGIESIDFIEGTSLETDTHFSEMDLLSLDLYIPDVTKLDDYGSVIFGDVQGLRYHIWDLSTTISGFSNGWNYLDLKFKDAETKVTNAGVTTYYTADTADLNNYNDLELRSLKFRFRGKGGPLTLYVDNPRIERNTFHEDVKFDKGLYLSNSEYVTFPLSEFDPHKGALEFWFKPDYNYFGTNSFYEFDSRTIFAYSNVANDLFGFFILKGYGPAIVTGNSDFMRIQYAESNSDIYFDVGDVVHLGFVWSNDGTAIDSFGTTARLYINGELAGSSYNTWEIRDTKSSRLLLGGAVSQKATSEDPTSIWAAVDNLKVYNYCKTDFSDRDVEGIDSIDILSPNSFLEISKDGVIFYDRNSAYLPLVFEDVPPGESRTVWVRTNIPENLTGDEKRTADLIIEAIRSF
jgi:hypothetical protein